MPDPTVIAVDWSGAKDRRAQYRGIQVAVVDPAGSWEVSGGRTREETVDHLLQRFAPPVFIGFDFSFGFPEWFAREHSCTTIDDVWALALRDGEQWLARTASPPFWRRQCEVPLDQRFRRCEARLRAAGFPAKSIFQLVGNGQVGPGSIRGMPLLTRLRAEGFAIWPFDAAGDRTVFEIYPTTMGGVEYDLAGLTRDAKDAVVSALEMRRRVEAIATLEAATDPVTRIEGDVWMPSPSP